MSRGKKAGIIVGCIIAIIVIVVIATRLSVLPPLGPLGPKVSVDYEVIIDDLGRPALRVRVEGPEKTYKVLLFNPEVVKVGEACIWSDDMIPRYATVDLDMRDYPAMSPVPREYWLIVKEMGFTTEERVFEAKPVFEGPDVSITNVQITAAIDYSYGRELGYMKRMVVQVYNRGDLPAYVQPKLLVAGKEYFVTGGGWARHGETNTINTGVGAVSGFAKGTYPVTVEIHSDGVKLDAYQTQVTFE